MLPALLVREAVPPNTENSFERNFLSGVPAVAQWIRHLTAAARVTARVGFTAQPGPPHPTRPHPCITFLGRCNTSRKCGALYANNTLSVLHFSGAAGCGEVSFLESISPWSQLLEAARVPSNSEARNGEAFSRLTLHHLALISLPLPSCEKLRADPGPLVNLLI